MQWINLELTNTCFAVIGKDENYQVNIGKLTHRHKTP